VAGADRGGVPANSDSGIVMPAAALVPVAAAALPAVAAGTAIAVPVAVGGGLIAGGGAVLGTVLKVIRTVRTIRKGVETGRRVVRGVQDARGALQRPPSEVVVASGRPNWDAEQLASIRTIADQVKAAALPPALASSRDALTVAAVVNAWHESRLRPDATNLTGRDESYGLFQVNRQGALGRPHTARNLLQAEYNTRVILGEVWTRRRELEAVLHRGGTVAGLTAAFTLHVERPAGRSSKALQRASTVRAWWGPRVFEARAYRWAV